MQLKKMNDCEGRLEKYIGWNKKVKYRKEFKRNICKEKREKWGQEVIFEEVMVVSYPKIMKDRKPHIEEEL